MTGPPGPFLDIDFVFHDSSNVGPFGVPLEIQGNTNPTSSGTESYSMTLPAGGHAGPGWTGPPSAEALALDPVMDMTYTLESADTTQKLTMSVTAMPVPNYNPGNDGKYNFALVNVLEHIGTDITWNNGGVGNGDGFPGSNYMVSAAGGDFTVTSSFTLRYTM